MTNKQRGILILSDHISPLSPPPLQTHASLTRVSERVNVLQSLKQSFNVLHAQLAILGMVLHAHKLTR